MAMNCPSLTPEEHRILERGVVELSAWSNVAYGSWGWTIMDLTHRGLLSHDSSPIHRINQLNLQSRLPVYVSAYANAGRQMDPTSRYTVTRAGRDAYVSYGRPYVPMTGQADEPKDPPALIR